MLLSDMTNSISAKTEEAITTNPLNFYSYWNNTDTSLADPRVSLGGTITDTIGDIVTAPANNSLDEKAFVIEAIEIFIFNNDTISHTVELSITTTPTDGTPATHLLISKFVLLSGEKAYYTCDNGWIIYTATGLVKTS